MKAIDLITRSLRGAKILGNGETARANMANDGLVLANEMLDSWSIDRLYVFQLLEEQFPLVVGQATYLIGPGGDFVTTRPTEIESAYVRLSSIDYTLDEIDNDAYSEIGLKTTIPSIPSFFYYDPKIPAGELNLWPNPSQAMTLFLQTPRQLTQFPDLTTDILFPPGYAEAVRGGLTLRLAEFYGMPVSQSMADLATNAIARVQKRNSSVPVLRPEFTTNANGRFNIYRGY